MGNLPSFVRVNNTKIINSVSSPDSVLNKTIMYVLPVIGNKKENFYNKIFNKFKMIPGVIVLVLVICGFVIEVPIFGDIMKWIGYIILGFNTIFALIIGMFIYIDQNKVWDLSDEKCPGIDKGIATFFIYVKYIIAYIVPAIILVSFIISSATSLTYDSENNNIYKFIFENSLTWPILAIITILGFIIYYVFNHANKDVENPLDFNRSGLFDLFKILITLIVTVGIVTFIIEKYTKFLTNNYKKEAYWVMFGFSIGWYCISCFRGDKLKELTDLFCNKLHTTLFTRCDINELLTKNIPDDQEILTKSDKKRAEKLKFTGDAYAASKLKKAKEIRKKLGEETKGFRDKINKEIFRQKNYFKGVKPDEYKEYKNEEKRKARVPLR